LRRIDSTIASQTNPVTALRRRVVSIRKGLTSHALIAWRLWSKPGIKIVYFSTSPSYHKAMQDYEMTSQAA
jgi:hypothetical protein